MNWPMFILFVAGGYSIGVCFYLHKKTDRLKFMALFWAAVTFLAAVLSNLLDAVTAGKIAEFITTQVVEWGYIYTIVLVLGALLLFVRESKPEFSRFPLFYAALPVILIISYLLVYDTTVLKWWILNIAAAGAITTAIIIYAMYTYYEKAYKTVLAGSILFLITFIMHLLTPESLRIMWQISLFISIVTTFTGYLIVDKHFAEE